MFLGPVAVPRGQGPDCRRMSGGSADARTTLTPEALRRAAPFPCGNRLTRWIYPDGKTSFSRRTELTDRQDEGGDGFVTYQVDQWSLW